jgi:hypothetical protein
MPLLLCPFSLGGPRDSHTTRFLPLLAAADGALFPLPPAGMWLWRADDGKDDDDTAPPQTL